MIIIKQYLFFLGGGGVDVWIKRMQSRSLASYLRASPCSLVSGASSQARPGPYLKSATGDPLYKHSMWWWSPSVNICTSVSWESWMNETQVAATEAAQPGSWQQNVGAFTEVGRSSRGGGAAECNRYILRFPVVQGVPISGPCTKAPSARTKGALFRNT